MIAATAAPVLLFFDPLLGGALILTVVASTNLQRVIENEGVDTSFLWWELGLSLPVLGFSFVTPDPNPAVVIVLGGAAWMILLFRSGRSTQPGGNAVAVA